MDSALYITFSAEAWWNIIRGWYIWHELNDFTRVSPKMVHMWALENGHWRWQLPDYRQSKCGEPHPAKGEFQINFFTSRRRTSREKNNFLADERFFLFACRCLLAKKSANNSKTHKPIIRIRRESRRRKAKKVINSRHFPLHASWFCWYFLRESTTLLLVLLLLSASSSSLPATSSSFPRETPNRRESSLPDVNRLFFFAKRFGIPRLKVPRQHGKIWNGNVPIWSYDEISIRKQLPKPGNCF